MLRLFRRGPSKKAMLAENERLRKLLADPTLIDIEIENGSIGLTCQHWAARLMAASFAASFGEARNWSAFQIGPMPTDKGLLLVTIQKMGGETPVAQLAQAKQIIERLLLVMGAFVPAARMQADPAVQNAREFLSPITPEA